MNAYEITYIVRPDLDEDQTRATVEGVTGRLEAAGAEIVAALPWNPPRRRMAYPIRDFGDGFYVTTVFRLDPQALRAFENNLKLNERVLRFLLVQATDLNIKQAEQRLQQQHAAAQPRPAPVPVPAREGEAPSPDGPRENVPVPESASETAEAEAPAPEPILTPEPVLALESAPTPEPAPVPEPDLAPEPAPEPVPALTETAG